MNVGFTGTQEGMTLEQKLRVHKFLVLNWNTVDVPWGLHGDCIGADHDFHRLVRKYGGSIWLHPPLNLNKRAFCDYDRMEDLDEYLVRNHAIVNHSDYMLATPKEPKEVLRSGTWATIRYARKIRPLTIIAPDGTLTTTSPDLC